MSWIPPCDKVYMSLAPKRLRVLRLPGVFKMRYGQNVSLERRHAAQLASAERRGEGDVGTEGDRHGALVKRLDFE